MYKRQIEESSLKTMSQVIEEELPEAEVAVLSGPSHAEEVSRGIPTTCVAGAHRKKVADYIPVSYTHLDVYKRQRGHRSAKPPYD